MSDIFLKVIGRKRGKARQHEYLYGYMDFFFSQWRVFRPRWLLTNFTGEVTIALMTRLMSKIPINKSHIAHFTVLSCAVEWSFPFSRTTNSMQHPTLVVHTVLFLQRYIKPNASNTINLVLIVQSSRLKFLNYFRNIVNMFIQSANITVIFRQLIGQ